jgi:hypothetical protein
MKRLFVFTMALLFLGFMVFGCSQQMSDQTDAGWVTLLDGPKGLENWERVGDANWRVVEGVVQADKKASKDNAFLLSKNSYKDFIIRAEFWVSDDAKQRHLYALCRSRQDHR